MPEEDMENFLRIRAKYYTVEPFSESGDEKKLYRFKKPSPDWDFFTENSRGPLDDEAKSKIYSLLQREIEPWLSTLFQSDHLSLLVGGGLSTAIWKLAGSSGKGVSMDYRRESKAGVKNELWGAVERYAKKQVENLKERAGPNLEDQISAMNELINSLDALAKPEGASLDDASIDGLDALLKAGKTSLEDERKDIFTELIKDILKQERSIIGKEHRAQKECDVREAAWYLIRFLMSFASRPSPRNRLNIFTTNYDRVIEYGATLAGLHLLDRFAGPLNPILRSSRLDLDMHYHPPGIRGEPRYVEGVVRFTKLHGSLDWIYDRDSKQVRRVGLSFGAESFAPYIEDQDKDKTSIIYPNTDKDRETSYYPYVDLMRDYAAAICRPNSTLVLYGYGLGDEHINRVIEDMLTIPSTHLVIIAYGDTEDRIKEQWAKHHAKDRITLLIGPQFADLKTLVGYYLPIPALEPKRKGMQRLLEQRGWDKNAKKDAKKSNDPPNGGNKNSSTPDDN